LDTAHIEAYRTSLSHHPQNLIRLCKGCHTAFDTGLIPIGTIRALKSELQARLKGLLSRAPGGDVLEPPPASPLFLGREVEMTAIIEALRTEASLLVTGVGGAGKTQLLVQALRRTQSGRPVFWFSVEQYATLNELKAALAALGARLGADGPDGVTKALDLHRACLVFDGVEQLSGDFEGVADLLQGLLGGAVATQVVVTSQASLPSLDVALEMRLRGLGAEAARAIMTGSASRSSASVALDRLIDFAEGHALTLRILRALIRHFGSADDVVTWVEALGVSALALPDRQTQSRQTSLELCLQLAFSQLNQSQLKLLWCLSQTPAGVHEAVLARGGSHNADFVPARAGLQRWDLVQVRRWAGLIRLSMLSPVRAFAQAWFQAHPPDDLDALALTLCCSVVGELNAIEEAFIHGGDAEIGMMLMERELPNAVAIFALAGRYSAPDFVAVQSAFSATLMTFLFTTGRFELGYEMMTRAAAAERDVGALEASLESLLQAQVLAERAGDTERANRALSMARAWAESGGPEAACLLMTMEAAQAERDGRHGEAEQLAASAYRGFVAQGGTDSRSAYIARFQQARAIEFGGRPQEALSLYQSVLEIVERRQDPINRGSTLHHIGNCLASMGHVEDAFESYLMAAQQFEVIGAVEFLSNSVGEAGLLLADLPPNIDVSGEAEPLLWAGLEDALREALRFAAPTPDFSLQRAIARLRKVGGAVWLAAQTSLREDLGDIAQEMAALIRQRHPVASYSRRIDGFEVYMFQLGWLLELMARLAEPYVVTPAPIEEVASLAVACSSAFAGPAGLRASMVSALRDYLRRRRGRLLTQDDLEDVIVAATSDGGDHM